ncbi:hypothetical protein [Marivita sp. S2033]|uniref:hypothetical protein n=1 Tax=Marivita sp. S2033 TaxID=3373187 RepID=UPI003982A0D3
MEYPAVLGLVVVILVGILAFAIYSRKKTHENLKNEKGPISPLDAEKNRMKDPKV